MKRFFRKWFLTLIASVILLVTMLAWWSSSRWSERHIRYIGTRSVEIFSANSLIRISFANGHIGSPGQGGKHTGYRHRNVRGKFLMRPLSPSFRTNRGLWEVTFGYWHLGVIAVIACSAALWADWKRATGRN
ncbi:MAG: hypothetical protein MI807_19225 [Verrucomicrobiales bacterium]|nr:hypothetical protein [Verrucomicrobiales bacterium]